MSDDGHDPQLEEVRNSQLLRAEYGIPSPKDEEWRGRSQADDQSIDDLTSQRAVQRLIDPIELARTEEVIARARFFARVRVATESSGIVVVATIRRVVPVLVGCAVATLLSVSVLALLVLARDEKRRARG